MRLIDADALVEKAYWHGEHPDVDHPFTEGVDAVDVSDIDEEPTIEVEPVRHGRWINPYINFYGHPCHCCSECGFKASYQDKNFCPNCGCKMSKEK